jgi:hypothetical protein
LPGYIKASFVYPFRLSIFKVDSKTWVYMKATVSPFFFNRTAVQPKEKIHSKEALSISTEYHVCTAASVLAFGTQVRGFKPGRSRRIFQGEKNHQQAFLRKGSKAVGLMS